MVAIPPIVTLPKKVDVRLVTGRRMQAVTHTAWGLRIVQCCADATWWRQDCLRG